MNPQQCSDCLPVTIEHLLDELRPKEGRMPEFVDRGYVENSLSNPRDRGRENYCCDQVRPITRESLHGEAANVITNQYCILDLEFIQQRGDCLDLAIPGVGIASIFGMFVGLAESAKIRNDSHRA